MPSVRRVGIKLGRELAATYIILDQEESGGALQKTSGDGNTAVHIKAKSEGGQVGTGLESREKRAWARDLGGQLT